MNTKSALKRNEINPANGREKIKLFGWELKDTPGELLWLSKDKLHVDHSYQRSASRPRVLHIAQKWSWLACGVIVVAQRGDEPFFYVVDGQHRVMAALKRSDIEQLPCLVFKTGTAKEEASAFYTINTGRRMPTTLEKWNSQLLAGDPTTTFVDALIQSAGRVAGNTATVGEVRCLTALLRAADSDRELLTHMWPLIVEVCQGKALHERIFEGLLWIEAHLPDGQSLADKPWRERVFRAGYAGLLEAAQRASTFYARGGAKVWALGMLEALNKGCRIHITLATEK